jgi:DNA-binding transcriptional ArsR family regulator
MKGPANRRPARKKSATKGRTAKPRPAPGPERPAHRWTFLSNHAHVLICLARDPDLRLREVANLIGITERAVQNILSDLEHEGLVKRSREGRRNTYELVLDRPLRHPIEKHCQVRDLVTLILK